ncbi:peptide-methionine (R)-S-oxide reductase MsrB [uncultured Aureimonas sp.]|uniref:peptide-methionine (R)-S-oxide reductase MsrB n=1 Tax=uncultured Aureimonas sp. TaxID=1604662 RepID=UPI0025E5584A|nr:peptide-methionine (R)-S-oxide reductase MsrB [uncultured Aureimonas sp.]
MQRRQFLLGFAAFGLGASAFALRGGGAAHAETFPFTLSDADWKSRLTSDQYAVLRQEATERPYSSPLNNVKTSGLFHCAGCDNALYSSATKFDSGTGWPSFWAPVAGAIGNRTDYVLVYPRTEVHCARCGGHLGHVFDDGPPPTGKRHCINGVAMQFKPGPVT